MIHHLGTQRIRARRLIAFSKIYLREPPSIYDLRTSRVSSPQRKSRFFKSLNSPYPSTPISHLPGAGTYALDSYRIFCTVHDHPASEEWKLVTPTDKELIRYLVCRPCFLINHLTLFVRRDGNGPLQNILSGLRARVSSVLLHSNI